MLEKKKVNIDVTEPLAQVQTIEDNHGNAVNILKYISCAEKEQFALELASLTLSADDDAGICYETALFEIMLNYLFVKYYTDIDVSFVQDIADYQQLYDYCEVNGFDYCRLCGEDYCRMMKYWANYSDIIIRLYNARHSFAHFAKQMLDPGVDPNNQETRELIEKLIAMKGAYDEKQANPVQVGGTVLNFAKRPKNN